MGGGISRMAKQELLATIRDRYQESSKKEKGRVLDEFIAVTGHHRKHGIRLLAQTGYDAREITGSEGPTHLRRGRPRDGDRDLGGCRPDLRLTAEGGAAQPGGVHGATWAFGSRSPGASATAGGQRVHPGPSAQTHQSHCGQPAQTPEATVDGRPGAGAYLRRLE